MELDLRIQNFIGNLNLTHRGWDTAVIVSKVNQYYFMGTMQDAFLTIDKNGVRAYFVRRSVERAMDESPLPGCVYPMNSYRDAAAKNADWGNTFLEFEVVPYGMLTRMRKYFQMSSLTSVDRMLNKTRSVKTPYELFWTEQSGKMHDKMMMEAVPRILREGMSEAEFIGELKAAMMRYDFQGWLRFQMFATEGDVGQIGFGENSLYPTNFDGPGGARGNSAAVPVSGSHRRHLKKGDLVFVDVGFGIGGYQTDKTQVFSFGAEPESYIKNIHRLCMDIQDNTAAFMVPGAVPSQIYAEIMATLRQEDLVNFMGFGRRSVKFLGHGVGLYIDEYPVIAKGFDEPLAENMVIALEPKKGIAGVGMVGVEETYVIEAGGARALTGGNREILVVK
ncbi:MAG: M24 family metallopeptidase [Oscillospiraceae bacterium]|nr:M24 family metallopeptidase [Oscillospiraceae bacterium]